MKFQLHEISIDDISYFARAKKKNDQQQPLFFKINPSIIQGNQECSLSRNRAYSGPFGFMDLSTSPTIQRGKLITFPMMVLFMINYAMIGFGPNGRGHVLENTLHPKLRKRLKLIAIYDPSPAIKERIIRKKKKVTFVDNMDALLDIQDLDAVIISSPPEFHARQAIAAMDAGLHVFSEVPMALTRDEIKQIIDAEENNPKIKYQFGENYAFIGETLYAKKLVAEGTIGEVVYCEAEYLHDITFKWRKGGKGGIDVPKVESWYATFDPLVYGHAIGPAQHVMGGKEPTSPFIEVQSYANSIGGRETRAEGEPVCAPAEAFHVGLFKTETGAIARCAAAYVFAREPVRRLISVTGRLGSYESPQPGKSGYLFLANDHVVNKHKHRAGKKKRIGQFALARNIPIEIGGHWGDRKSTRLNSSHYS